MKDSFQKNLRFFAAMLIQNLGFHESQRFLLNLGRTKGIQAARKISRKGYSAHEINLVWHDSVKKQLQSFGFDQIQIRENIEFPSPERELARVQFHDASGRRLKYLIPWYISGWFSGFSSNLYKKEISFQVLRHPQKNVATCAIEGHLRPFHDGRSARNYLQFSYSKTLKPILAKSLKLAKTDLPLLIVGESGVGKEHFARFLHHNSGRRNKPFVFIHAERTKMNDWLNALSSAVGGTLFIHKIYAFPKILMEELVRELHENQDVRFICTSNLSLKEMMEHRFLPQQMQRHFFPGELRLPPLRERPEDVVPLATKILQQISYNKWHFSPAVLTDFVHYSWPGNISELYTVINYMVTHNIYGNSELDHELLPTFFQLDSFRQQEEQISPGKTLQQIERQAIEATLEHTGGNKRQAAQILNIGYNTLWRKLQAYEREPLN